MENYGHISKLDAIDFAFLVDRFDMNGDGVVTYPEFEELIMPTLTDPSTRIM